MVNPMPDLKWEWRVGPHTILSLAQLFAIIVAVIGGFLKMQSDLDQSKLTITELRSIVASVRESQGTQAERITRVETKVDIILPSLQRIEARQMARDPQHQ